MSFSSKRDLLTNFGVEFLICVRKNVPEPKTHATQGGTILDRKILPPVFGYLKFSPTCQLPSVENVRVVVSPLDMTVTTEYKLHLQYGQGEISPVKG